MMIYRGQFDDWSDVQEQFGHHLPEPDQVLIAIYECEAYESRALVIYRQNNEFGWVAGSHCSCYGLNGQWQPTLYDAGTFRAYLARLAAGHGFTPFRDVARELLATLPL